MAEKKVIVTTTIHPPTEAVLKYDQMPGWTLIVAGDRKTPAGYRLKNGIYLSPAEQEKYHPALSEAIGWDCIQRRNFGFLWAKDLGADIIATVDDDNIPYEDWGSEVLAGREAEVGYFETGEDCFDPVGATNYPHLWHRGFPLEALAGRDYSRRSRRKVRVDVQAGFWDGDPDIDAVCRMRYAPECRFDSSVFPFAAGALSPFDSQNTILHKDVLPEYFMFPGVGRMDDIWAAYYVQSRGFRVAYSRPSVFQKRNVQDLAVNLADEMPGYRRNAALVSALRRGTCRWEDFLPERALRAFQIYRSCFS